MCRHGPIVFIFVQNHLPPIECKCQFLSVYPMWFISNEQKANFFLFLKTEMVSDYVVLWLHRLSDLSYFQYQCACKHFQCVCPKFKAVSFVFATSKMFTAHITRTDRRICLNQFRIWYSSSKCTLCGVSGTSFWTFWQNENAPHPSVMSIKNKICPNILELHKSFLAKHNEVVTPHSSYFLDIGRGLFFIFSIGDYAKKHLRQTLRLYGWRDRIYYLINNIK